MRFSHAEASDILFVRKMDDQSKDRTKLNLKQRSKTPFPVFEARICKFQGCETSIKRKTQPKEAICQILQIALTLECPVLFGWFLNLTQICLYTHTGFRI